MSVGVYQLLMTPMPSGTSFGMAAPNASNLLRWTPQGRATVDGADG